ncbi:MAG: type IX secretion system membrane protein PorP/SprF [Saprospirales bacterium]|nr:type IX secretion system membrane protein PorP/SprF [Saprospirales bacterium]MBK8920566.1 type IX secretion system membrane protein PorP/SprF [Saprospirales bacterium]
MNIPVHPSLVFRTKKTWVYALLLAATTAPVFAQQEPQYTQFMFNKLAYNPGYAGSFVSPALTAIYRNQWMGIEGAPNTQVLSFNQPVLNERVGIGANLVRNSIGINRNFTLDLVYCYRIPMRRGHLGIGMQPSVRNFWQNWNDSRLYSPTPAGTDLAIPLEPRSKWTVNFGFGLYYSHPDKGWYVGMAVPRFFKNNIDFSENGGVLSREDRHFNAMGGFTLTPKPDLEIMPQLLLKFVPNAPFDAELNVLASLRKKFYGGLTYRAGGDTNGAGESVDVLAGLQATEKLFLGLSYDIGLTRLRKFHNGSVEATVRWWFNPPEGAEVQSGYGF